MSGILLLFKDLYYLKQCDYKSFNIRFAPNEKSIFSSLGINFSKSSLRCPDKSLIYCNISPFELSLQVPDSLLLFTPVRDSKYAKLGRVWAARPAHTPEKLTRFGFKVLLWQLSLILDHNAEHNYNHLLYPILNLAT